MAKVAIISFVPVLINFGVWQLHRGLKRSKVKLARHDHRNRFGKRHNRVRVFCEERRGGKTRDASRDSSFWNHLFQLDMRQSVALSRYVIGRSRGFQCVKHGVERSVGDDMDVKRESREVKASHE